ncbi:TIGR03936 family radical SAM-associated protein [Hydrogenoanaerobacterium sp.]|uniref:TIGR03936 family radical SAM-associated protein n=1 Tax=Hydrogenoanaerobacterium sp. TaxID=2953763 RepID=UPI0028A0E148|nr:TIGR03936 family radical SAM-associated protein [Hydrogenoanaerobacterium sp.]
MDMSNVRDIRVFYTRRDAAKYISHLDINRCFQRALARSHLPVWYTQGFNPHIYITFAMPTPLGYESDCETMDLRVIEEISMNEIKDRLNAALPMGFRVYKVAAPVHKPDDIAVCDYQVLASAPHKTGAELEVMFREMLTRDTILVEKKTKKGFKEIDLKPFIELKSLEAEDDGIRLVLRLAAGTTININPTLVFDAFSKLCDVELDCIRVKKLQVYTDNPIKDEFFE